MTKKLKVGILGCEHCHIRGFARLVERRNDLQVTQIWGRDVQRTAHYAELFGARCLSGPDRLQPVDIAVVLSDTRDHADILEAIVGKADAVHIDKPMGLNATDAARVARLAEPYRDQFGVGFFARHNPMIQEMGHRIAKGDIGRLMHLSVTFGHAGLLEGWLNDWPALTDRARMGYGGFGDLGSNVLDVATVLAGRLAPVTCALDKREGYAEDVGGLAVARSEDGAFVRIYASLVLQGPRFEVRADGEEGSLWFRGKSLGVFGQDDEPEILMRGQWSEASDSPEALINQLVGQPYFPVATATEGLRINQLLDEFQVIAANS